jgi:serine/threonine protein kinase
MATGRPPFRAEGSLAVLHRICREPHRPAWESNANLPDELCDVIDRLLEKKPARRFATAEEVSQTLAELLSRAQQRGLGRRRWRIGRPRQTKWTVLSATLIAASIVTFAIWNGAGEHQPPKPDQQASPGVVDSMPDSATVSPEVITASDRQKETEFKASNEEFAAEAQSVRNATARLSNESVYLQNGDEEWSRTIHEIDHALKELEAGRVF